MKTKVFWKYSEPKTKSSVLIVKILEKKLGHTAVKLESRHATGEQELTEVLSGTSYPSRKGEEPYTLLNLQQSSEENRKVICVSNQYRLTSYCVPPPELMKNENQCAWITEFPLPFILCCLCILRVSVLIVIYFSAMTTWKTRKLHRLGKFNISAEHQMISIT